MKVILKNAATAGKVQIEPGEYLVSVRTDVMAIQLVGRGKDYLVPAIRRPIRAKGRRTVSVSFYSLGGGQWSLVVAVPKHGEFLCTLKYADSSGGAGGGGGGGGGAAYDLDKAMKKQQPKPGEAKPGTEKPLPGKGQGEGSGTASSGGSGGKK